MQEYRIEALENDRYSLVEEGSFPKVARSSGEFATQTVKEVVCGLIEDSERLKSNWLEDLRSELATFSCFARSCYFCCRTGPGC